MAWRAISTRRSRFACRSPSPRNCAISTRKSAKRGPADGSAAEKQVEQQREHQAQQQAGDDRKIEMDIAAVERDVAGQPSQEWDSQAKEEDQADHHDEAADDDEQLANLGHELSYRPHRVPSPLRGGTGRGSLEPDPADRLFDLGLVQ